MKDLETWLDEYAICHQNPTNKKIHFICVPLIVFSLLGILLSISFWLLFAFIIISLLFYSQLSIKLSFYMLISTLVMVAILLLLPHLLIISITVFVISWIFQFIGHKIEGKKPSFFKDIQFLFIGPLWVLHYLINK